MNLPQHFMDEMRRRVSLAQLIGKYVKLTRRSNGHLGLCPFHQEKTPSFNVRDDEGYYHCFGCGVSGDAITFLREKEGLDFMEAVQHLADKAGMTVPNHEMQDPETKARNDKILTVLNDAARYFESALIEKEPQALNYLKERGFDQDAITTFRLGYAPKSGLIEGLKRFGHTDKDMLEAGLLRVSKQDQNNKYAFFRHRLMFPIINNRDQVIAFGARTLSQNQEPKYLNSSESAVFQKKYNLYGVRLAREGCRNNLPLVVAEGYMDVIAIQQSGVAAAVAPLGTALTEEQIKLLWRIHDVPILCFDGDKAGKSATLQALLRSIPLLEPGKSLRFAFLPPGVDPDDYIQTEGKEAFQEFLEKAFSWVDAFWQGVSQDHQLNDPSGRANFWREIRSHVKEINNGQMRAAIGDEIERRIATMREEVRGSFSGRGSAPQGFRPKVNALPSLKKNPRQPLILGLLLEHPSLLSEFYEDICLLKFQDTAMENLRQSVIMFTSLQTDKKDISLDKESLRQHLKQHGHSNFQTDTLLKDRGQRSKGYGMSFSLTALTEKEATKRLVELLELEKKLSRSSVSRSIKSNI